MGMINKVAEFRIVPLDMQTHFQLKLVKMMEKVWHAPLDYAPIQLLLDAWLIEREHNPYAHNILMGYLQLQLVVHVQQALSVQQAAWKLPQIPLVKCHKNVLVQIVIPNQIQHWKFTIVQARIFQVLPVHAAMIWLLIMLVKKSVGRISVK